MYILTISNVSCHRVFAVLIKHHGQSQLEEERKGLFHLTDSPSWKKVRGRNLEAENDAEAMEK